MVSRINPKFISSDMTDDAELAEGLALKQSLSEKDQPNGYAGLDSTGKVPMALLPSDLGSSAGTVDGGSPTSQYLTENLDGGDVNGN